MSQNLLPFESISVIADSWKHGGHPVLPVSDLNWSCPTPYSEARRKEHLKQTDGRSMVEMLGVLAIIGVITVASLAGYQYAMSVIRSNRVMDDVQSYYVAIMGRRTLPSDLKAASLRSVKPVSGYTFEIAVHQDTKTFDVYARGLPENMCKVLMNKDIKGMEVSLEAGGTVCTSSSNLTFSFPLKANTSDGSGGDDGESGGGESGGGESGGGESGGGEPTGSCAGIVCQNGGTCNNGVCDCVGNWAGTTCNTCADNWTGTTCTTCGLACNGQGIANAACTTCTCNKGYYGTSACTACPAGQTTPGTGATSISQCYTVDPCAGIVCQNGGTCNNGVCDCVGTWSGETCTTCGLACNGQGIANAACTTCTCNKGYYGTSACTACPAGQTTAGTGSTSISQCYTPDPCAGIVCQNGGTCNNGVCDCVGAWSGETCTECLLLCHNGSTVNAACSACNCVGNWGGSICTECRLFCANGSYGNSECTSCVCSGNWGGTLCDTCNLTCNNHGTADAACTSCTCDSGWTGTNCETAVSSGNCGTTYETCDSTCSTGCQAKGWCGTYEAYYEYRCEAGSCTCVGMSGTPSNSGSYINCCLCLAEGTLITMADGSQKAIEDIDYTDELRVWDFDEGCFAVAKPLWIKMEQEADEYNLLTFADGRTLKTISQHRIFNKEMGKFTYPMTDDTPIATTTWTDEGVELALASKQIVKANIRHYNIITERHLNCFANGVLTSCRLNNLYAIKDMKFIKDNRALRPMAEFAGLPTNWIKGLRLMEQPIEINRGNDVNHGDTLQAYVMNCLALDKKALQEKAV